MLPPFLQISPRISVLPIIHGSGDFAVEVRRVMLTNTFDCVAVPLPESFQSDVETAIERLPQISLVLQRESEHWDADDEADQFASYVPVDPCQGVIAALRIAVQERIPREFIDLETESYEPVGTVLPDPYALKKVPVEQFAAAILPSIPRLRDGQSRERVRKMADRLRELERRYSKILFVCAFSDWPWIREAYQRDDSEVPEHDEVSPTEAYPVRHDSLLFVLGELPFITSLYESARAELDDDSNLSIDGVKELILETRDAYRAALGGRARSISPQTLSLYLKYVRNLSLLERRMTPDLYTLVVAAQQMMGDQFAIALAEAAGRYSHCDPPSNALPVGCDRCRTPDGEEFSLKSRLPGVPFSWRTCTLTPRPPRERQREWSMRWDPFQQCSWPEEDVSIERFRARVHDAAMASLGAAESRTEKFSASLKDGLDLRETLRNWHTGDLYVKVFPPTRGNVDCVLMLFDSPADPRDYPWRCTWMAEHDEESTLVLFATDFQQQLVGPGIGLANYGGALFLYPPRAIPDVWIDPRFNYADTLEERLLAAACFYSKERHIAVLSESPPGVGWQRLARNHSKRLVHVPLGRFSQSTVAQLRMFHVLNGKEVRSFAAHFIRKA